MKKACFTFCLASFFFLVFPVTARSNGSGDCILCHDMHRSAGENLIKKTITVCLECHLKVETNTASMEKQINYIPCNPVRERKCFECHIPKHSDKSCNYKTDGIAMCARCHDVQHKITHPLGAGIIDPRNGQTVTCISCHSMHSASSEYMLVTDRNRDLCIQCHSRNY